MEKDLRGLKHRAMKMIFFFLKREQEEAKMEGGRVLKWDKGGCKMNWNNGIIIHVNEGRLVEEVRFTV